MSTKMILPIQNAAILPDVEFQVGIDKLNAWERSRLGIDGNKAILLQTRTDKDREHLTAADFYPLGVLADIIHVADAPNGMFIHVRTHEKVRISNLAVTMSVIEADFEPVNETMDITFDGEREQLEQLKTLVRETAEHFRGGEYVEDYIRNIHTVRELAVAAAPFLGMSIEEQYAWLATDSYRERLMLIRDAFMKYRATVEMKVDLAKSDDTEEKAYKKAAIKKQMNVLQKELDEMDPEGAVDKDDFARKIAESGMPEDVRKEIEKTLERFQKEPETGAEYNSLHDYLDFVTTLKWKAEPGQPINIKKAREVLDRDHYGLEKVKERILQHLAVMSLYEKNGEEKQKGSILLLVGAPGTGKTSLGKSIAEALDREYIRISLGGIRDESEIRGHRRTYIGSMPGRIMQGIKRAGVMNPVMVLDEVDKLMGGINGDPSAALLEVLDPEQNTTFEDHYVNVPYDLSQVFFICTANNWDTIPQPLMDRMEVIQIQGYTPDEHFHIAKDYLVPQVREDTGLSAEQITFTDEALKKIIDEYTMEAGVRGLKKQLLTACRKAAQQIVEAESAEPGTEEANLKSIAVTEDNVEDFLGKKVINHDKVLKDNPAGVVTGLAWTQAGGEILFIESVAMNGSGQIRLTGQIGDVMRESAETAVSLVKSTFLDNGLDFKDRDIHIHIPQGAVQKDGPSAGITMFTAVTSLVTGKPVSPYLAMTGEISLRGQVLPIGGLPEKLMAAERAGIKKVLIPDDNVRDLDDVPEEIRDKLEIVPVKTVEDVIREALHITLPSRDPHPFVKQDPGKSGTAAPASL